VPLHQRVQIARASGCSGARTLQAVLGGRKRNRSEGVEMLIHSCTRFRERLGLKAVQAVVRQSHVDARHEESQQQEAVCRVVSLDSDQGRVLTVAGSGFREFLYPRVLTPQAAQPHVYEQAARKVVIDFVNGFNGTVLTYGQTGSGKTYTMFGPAVGLAERHHHNGLAQRAFAEVIDALREREGTVDAKLAMSYVEVFGNEISDLLRNGVIVGQDRGAGRYQGARATDRVGHRYVLDGDTEMEVSSLSQLQELLAKGDEQKRRAATAMNERSTRAHSVLVLSLTQVHKDTGATLKSRLFLADLGGSEKLSRSKVHEELRAPAAFKEVNAEGEETLNWTEYYRTRERVQETLNINRGLYALKRCIAALRMNADRAVTHPDAAPIYVPYQDSKLTLLLSEGLGGNSKTALVATATEDVADAGETLQTLRFAESCSQVKMDVGVSSSGFQAAALAELDEEIRAVEALIKQKERWEEREVVRSHAVALKEHTQVDGKFVDDTDGTYKRREALPVAAGSAQSVQHTVRGMRLVGAEREREQLERFLEKRAILVKGVKAP